ncbi:hypothetical protein H5395_16555 [Paracoccus sp. MC1854]|uniref:hypothetical protein n=1 Tax=Paracoccus sp. MC1854 TaxID=2760306 RepID=UPI00160441B8|nr:hypothetical protein [Paracoccus sp. MC1854]MBB1493086.1 hypothetical protein [Paracoccus sp. MC1854]
MEIAMTQDRPLSPGDRIIITAVPDGFIYHVETREGSIRAGELKARSFRDTVARIEEGEAVS